MRLILPARVKRFFPPSSIVSGTQFSGVFSGMTPQPFRVHTEAPTSFFAGGFSRIAAERMAGLPICRTDISVQVPQFIRYEKQWLGVAVTPWSLLVLLACGDRDSWQSIPTGIVRAVRLPAGEFSFLGMNDPILGEYQACSLMSPLGPDIPDQTTALAVALSAFRMMLSDMPEPPEERGTSLKKRVIPIQSTASRDQTSEATDAVRRRNFFTRYWK